MDSKSHEILRVLERDGRISNIDLANRVALSPSACLRRVQEMERSGVIAGYRTVVNLDKIGIGFVAYVAVGLSSHNRQSQEAFERSISRSPEVRECHNVSGAYEYLLRVETADIAAFKVFHTDVLGAIAQVNLITSHIVIASPKDDRA